MTLMLASPAPGASWCWLCCALRRAAWAAPPWASGMGSSGRRQPKQRPVSQAASCVPSVLLRQMLLPTCWSQLFSHKYLVVVDGNGAAARLGPTLCSGSLALNAQLFREWFVFRLRPFRHYIPVRWAGQAGPKGGEGARRL